MSVSFLNMVVVMMDTLTHGHCNTGSNRQKLRMLVSIGADVLQCFLFEDSTYTSRNGKNPIDLNALGIEALSLYPHCERYHRQAGEKNANGGDSAFSHVGHQERLGDAEKFG